MPVAVQVAQGKIVDSFVLQSRQRNQVGAGLGRKLTVQRDDIDMIRIQRERVEAAGTALRVRFGACNVNVPVTIGLPLTAECQEVFREPLQWKNTFGAVMIAAEVQIVDCRSPSDNVQHGFPCSGRDDVRVEHIAGNDDSGHMLLLSPSDYALKGPDDFITPSAGILAGQFRFQTGIQMQVGTVNEFQRFSVGLSGSSGCSCNNVHRSFRH